MRAYPWVVAKGMERTDKRDSKKEESARFVNLLATGKDVLEKLSRRL